MAGGGRSVHLAGFDDELAAIWPAYLADASTSIAAIARDDELALTIQHHAPVLRGALIWRPAR